jgi:hypothetical protein
VTQERDVLFRELMHNFWVSLDGSYLIAKYQGLFVLCCVPEGWRMLGAVETYTAAKRLARSHRWGFLDENPKAVRA